MKILIRQFLGKNHSWAVCGWGWARALKSMGHSVDLFSTDGIQHLPVDLKNNLIGYCEEKTPNVVYGVPPRNSYDCQISYTAMKNFPAYLSNGNVNRFGTWVYEWDGKNVLPTGFAKHYRSCNYLLAPSVFGKNVFINSGIPEDKIKVVPHGIDVERYRGTTTVNLPTNKKFKILANVAQNHKRKNIPGLLEAYGKAFTEKDDVCLILKAKDKKITMAFEVSLADCLNSFYSKFPKHAEIKVFSEFVDDISALYRSVDAVFTMAHCEGFYFPGLEGLASGKLSIAPKYGGQLDFLDSTNSLLIDGQETRADPNSMYWDRKANAIWFAPSISDAVEKLKYAYNNYEQLNKQVEAQRDNVYNQYSWLNVVKQITELCK